MLRSAATWSAAAGIAYLSVALVRMRRFERRACARATAFPSVTILKPLAGIEDGLYENLCSFCEQEYPVYKVLFSVREADDPAADVARRVVERFPQRAELVAGGPAIDAANPKVANLSQIIERANGDVLVFADADMRVAPSYLLEIVEPLADPKVGAVTCLFAGSGRDPISVFAAQAINEQFVPSVLVAGALEPMRYCIGATIAMRRSDFAAIGGLEALAPHVADDYKVGMLVAERGMRVALADYVVEDVIAEPSLLTLWEHELRWSRTIRSVRPFGHAFSFLTYGLPLAILAGRVELILAAAALRVAMHYTSATALGVRDPGSPLLIPLRDTFSLAVWAASFFGRNVTWRERRLRLDASGLIER